MEMSKAYNPKEVEEKIYAMWEEGGYFTPKIDKAKKPFCIIMPPPNANGALHVGHALFVTLQDLMVRYHRMKGDCSLWLPGADHAGFETQVVFDKKLEKEKRKKSDIPREQLVEEMLAFTQENKKIMEGQLKKLGASCDWQRGKFTLDKDIVDIVYQTFEKLKQDNLVYKGCRLVNWCIKHQTTLSDLEIKHQEEKGSLYYIKYPLVNKKDSFVTVATTRPETMLGDTAVAVNPEDKRYKDLIGKKLILPLIEREIPIIKDKTVDMEFGTGAVKVTPAHDFADFDIWQAHQDEIEGPISVIDNYGRITLKGEWLGKKMPEARELIVAKLKDQGFLAKIDETYVHNVSVCYKCGNVIEPSIMDNQWFIKMTDSPAGGGASLRDLALEAVKKGEVKFFPERFEKIFLQWLENLKDWNISRQIAWGIPIPGDETGQVFDTWFSSGQWPFATLQANNKEDFEYFYPTSVMETAADILFFWVARMVMLGIYATGKAPFHNVYLHGVVRDKDKQKMSKSKGNVIDPLGVVEERGADALRMALVFANSPGQDITFSEEKIIAQRRFANKVWNASRYVLNNKGQLDEFKANTAGDKAILDQLNEAIKSVSEDIEKYQFHEAAQTIYQFFWHSFCDVYIEQSKKQIEKGSAEEQENTRSILVFVLRESLKLLHPFMPFITEQIYQTLDNKDSQALIISSWPKVV